MFSRLPGPDTNIDKSLHFDAGYARAIEQERPDLITLEGFTPPALQSMIASCVLDKSLADVCVGLRRNRISGELTTPSSCMFPDSSADSGIKLARPAA